MIALILSSMVSSSSPSSAPVSAAFSAAAALPPWLEWASSMMIAKRRSLMQRPDIVEDERELLNRRDDDLLAVGDEAAKVAGMLGVADGRADLRELLDGVADLLIEDAPVGDHDHRVEHLAGVIGEPHQLVRQPRDRVRLARSRRMLDQDAPPCALRLASARACGRHRVDGSAGRADRALPCPVFGSCRSTIWA